MIGPSSSSVTGRDMADDQLSRKCKKRIFDELDIESFCDEICDPLQKRHAQEIDDTIEFISPSEISTPLFSPLSLQDPLEDGAVTRLEVLVVDGNHCTWTTPDDLVDPGTYIATTDYQDEEHRDERHHHRRQVTWETQPQPAVVSCEGFNRPKVNREQRQFVDICDNVDDQENGNLSWLLDFKLDPFIESTDDRSNSCIIKDNRIGVKSKQSVKVVGAGYSNERKSNECSTSSSCNEFDNSTAHRSNGLKKPPFTYTELIEHALQERGELTVSAIYQWISEHFPYYKSNDDRWKNSVRHNLSINPHFRKGSKAPHGAGHLWAIANRAEVRPRGTYMTLNPANAAKQILNSSNHSNRKNENVSQMIALDEVATATASIAQQLAEEDAAAGTDVVDSVTLEHCAEQILSGIKREVEVQYIVPMTLPNGTEQTDLQDQQNDQTELECPVKATADFLNPVSKEVLVEECGLIGEGYLVTDLNPAALGLNMIDPDMVVPENLFGEEFSFQLYELASPSQLQSA